MTLKTLSILSAQRTELLDNSIHLVFIILAANRCVYQYIIMMTYTVVVIRVCLVVLNCLDVWRTSKARISR